LPILRKAAEWYAVFLMGNRLSKNINIRVNFIDRLQEEHNEGGNCIWEDDYVRPREFTINLAKDGDVEEVLTNFAHEMVHVKQWARGEIKDVMKAHSLCKWKGEEINIDDTNYWDLPWEIEAHGREKGMYLRFCEYAGITNDI
jgi:hypothetical protein